MGRRRGMHALLSWLFPSVCLGQDAATSETCAAGGQCADAAAGLKWRGYPYYLTDPRYAKTIYGGNYVKDAFREAGFEGPMDGEDWDVLWTHRPQTKTLLEKVQLPPRKGDRLVNHCNYYSGGGDKCAFAKITRALARKRGDPATSGYLPTFEFDDQKQLQEWRTLVRKNPQQHWVIKPCFGGGSMGIQIKRGEDALRVVTQGKPMVAQEYLENPYPGLGGHKFHLRLYVLVTRWEPAVGAYLFDEGLVFRSLVAHAPGGERSEKNDVFSGISDTVEVLPLADLWDVVDAEVGKDGSAAATPAVSSVMVRDRIANLVQHMLGNFPDKGQSARRLSEQQRSGFHCFDLFGIDVLLDERLWPWVMEINIGANMWIDDRGKQNRERLMQTKGVLMAQVLSWAAERARSPPANVAAAEGNEQKALSNFTRLL